MPGSSSEPPGARTPGRRRPPIDPARGEPGGPAPWLVRLRAVAKNHPRALSCLWIALLVLLILPPRLRDPGAPLLGAHAWKQIDTAAIARNFYRGGMRFWRPQIDWNGDKDMEVECEFPLFAYLVAIGYKLYGRVETALGRLLAAAFSIATAIYLYLFGRDLFGPGLASAGVVLYGWLPLNLVFNRAFMPDNAMVFFSVALVYHFRQWQARLPASPPASTSSKGRRKAAAPAPSPEHDAAARHRNLAFLFASLAFLCKIPTLYLGLPLLILVWQRHGPGFLRRPALWAFAILPLAPAALWYTYAHRFPASFGIWNIGTNNWGNWAIWTSMRFYDQIFYFLHNVVLTELGLAFAVGGILSALFRPRERFLAGWATAIVVFYFLVAEGNIRHSYYHLPTCAIGTLLILSACKTIGDHVLGEHLARPVGIPLLLAGLAFTANLGWERHLTITRQQRQFYQILAAARAIGRRVPPRDLVLTHYIHGQPELLYLSDRKGFHTQWRDGSQKRFRSLMGRGAKWVGFLYPPTAIQGKQAIPVGPLAFLEREGIEGNIWYRRGFGGYLLEPLTDKHPFLVEPRKGMHYSHYARALHTMVGMGDERFDSLTHWTGFEIFIVELHGEKEAALRRRLSRHAYFALVDVDGRHGIWLLRSRRFRDAIRRLELLEVDPVNDRFAKGIPTQVLGASFRKRLEARVAELRLLAIRHPYALSIWSYLGHVQAGLGRMKEAQAAYEKVLERSPPHGALLIANLHATLTGRTDEAFRWYLRCIRHDPKNTTARFNIGLLHLKRNELAQAGRVFREVITLDARAGKAWYNLACLDWQNGDRAGARTKLEKARGLGVDVSKLETVMQEAASPGPSLAPAREPRPAPPAPVVGPVERPR